ncbi:MAG: four helix bundle protein [Chitinophagales bacterium]|nr:four helix bundle protein [Chitinophagales bacterium]
MESKNWLEYKIQIRERLRTFSLDMLNISENIEKNTASRVINYQLTKSGTSVYATNYRAVLRARSKAEFFSKLSICVEEADETEMWLELLIASNISNNEKIREVHKESIELVKILASMQKKLA